MGALKAMEDTKKNLTVGDAIEDKKSEPEASPNTKRKRSFLEAIFGRKKSPSIRDSLAVVGLKKALLVGEYKRGLFFLERFLQKGIKMQNHQCLVKYRKKVLKYQYQVLPQKVI